MDISKNIRKKFILKETVISLIIITTVFILDRASKINIIKLQINNDNSFYVNDYLNFDLIWNSGIAFGLLTQNANIYYHVITTLIFLVIAFLGYLISKANFIDKVFFSLILGGALGNFYDRLSYFAVPDFIDIHYQSFHWFTFNIADIFITLGIMMILTKDLFFIK